MRLLSLSVAIASSVFLAACGGNEAGPSKPSTQPAKKEVKADKESAKAPTPIVFTLAVNGKADAGRMVVEGTTNLPDDTKVTVLLNRPVIVKGESEVRSTHIGGAGSAIQKGRFEVTVDLEEGIYALLPAATISPKATICVEVRTGDEDGKPIQPASVSKLIGKHGERLVGSPAAQVFGSATDNPVTQLIAQVDAPLRIPRVPGQATSVKSLKGFC